MNQAGDIAEMAMMLAATKQGWTVFTPYGHQTKVDMILMKNGGKPVTVQVKKGSLQRKHEPHHASSWKVLIGSCRSATSTSNAPRLVRYVDEFDIMAVYISELNILAFYELSAINGKASMRWNEGKSRRNNWEIFDKYNKQKQ